MTDRIDDFDRDRLWDDVPLDTVSEPGEEARLHLAFLYRLNNKGLESHPLNPDNDVVPEYLFHGSGVAPEIIFKTGLLSNAARNNALPHYDVAKHQHSSAIKQQDGTYSGFISTTDNISTAIQFVPDMSVIRASQGKTPYHPEVFEKVDGEDYPVHKGYVYRIKSDGIDFLNLNIQPDSLPAKSSQTEWAVRDAIPAENIVDAIYVDGPYKPVFKNGVPEYFFPRGVPITKSFENVDGKPKNTSDTSPVKKRWWERWKKR